MSLNRILCGINDLEKARNLTQNVSNNVRFYSNHVQPQNIYAKVSGPVAKSNDTVLISLSVQKISDRKLRNICV